MQIILQRRASDQQAALGVVDANNLRQGAVLVLDAVGLVDGDVAPVELEEVALFNDAQFVRGDDDVEAPALDLVLHDRDAVVFLPIQDDDADHEAQGEAGPRVVETNEIKKVSRET